MSRVAAAVLVGIFAGSNPARAAEPGASGSHAVAVEQHPPRASGSDVEQTAPHATPDETAVIQRESWYGWQSLSADGAALLLLIAAGASSDQKGPLADVLGYSALGVYLTGGPLSHFAHDSPGRGLGSLALRAGLPIAGGAIGYNLENCSGSADYDLCGIVGAITGGVLGIAIAIGVDAALLGYEDVPVSPSGVQSVGMSISGDHAVLVTGGRF